MADSVVRLVVDSKEYDSKIQRATQGLIQYEKKCREVGGTLEFVEKEELDFVKALGQMETVSSSATGKLGELKRAFTELSVQYKNLTDAEKASPYGKALAGSLDQIKGRIKSLEGDLKSAQGELTSMSGVFEQFAGKIGLPTQLLGTMGLAIGAVTAAIKVSKDAFMASESNIDEWGRTVESAKGVYEGFLTAINTGDISGFLSRIREIITASSDAYDALDRLGTQKAINNAAYQQQNVENERNRAMLRTGRYIAPNDGRKAEMAEGIILTKEQRAKIAADLESGLKAINQIVRDEIDQTTKAINELYTKQAKVLGMSEEEFRKGTASMAEFDKRLEGYAKYLEIEGKKKAVSAKASGGMNLTNEESAILKQANPYESYKGWGVFKDDGDLFAQINQLINQRASLQQQNYGQMAQAYRSINTATGVSARGGGGGGESIPATEGSIKAQEEEVARLTDLWKNATAELRDGYKQQLDEAKVVLDQMVKGTTNVPTEPQELNPSMPGRDMTAFEKLQQSVSTKLADSMQAVDMSSLTNLMAVAIQNGIDELNPDFEQLQYKLGEGLDISDEAWNELVAKLNEMLESMQLQPIELDVKTGGLKTVQKDAKDTMTQVQGAAMAFQALGDAMSQIEDPGAKVAGLIAQAIGSVVAGYGAATMQASARGPWAWIAFAMTGLATMISMVAGIKSATAGSYATGGIIPGNSYSGDNLTANVNSGELILNRAQQDSIAGQLNGAAAQTVYVEGVVSGKNLILAIQNEQSQSGVPSAKILAAH